MTLDPATLEPTHFLWSFADSVATITLNRPERKNPLTFDSYAELRDTFSELTYTPDVKCVVLTGAGGNFCSGGDVHEIIGPLTKMDESGLLRFTRMTGDLVKAMRACPQPIVAAVEGVCAGAGAIMAMASDLRLASPDAKTAFLFSRVGLSGADMGAWPSCSLPADRWMPWRASAGDSGTGSATTSWPMLGSWLAVLLAARPMPTGSPSASWTPSGMSRSRKRSTWKRRHRPNA
jgi:hypothetical protein